MHRLPGLRRLDHYFNTAPVAFQGLFVQVTLPTNCMAEDYGPKSIKQITIFK